MRLLRAALALCALASVPAVLSAQTVPQQQAPHAAVPPARRSLPYKRPVPAPTAANRHHQRPTNPNRANGYGVSSTGNGQYQVLIDSSVVNRYLATPTPAPKHQPTPRPKSNGEDVFETHSSDDAK